MTALTRRVRSIPSWQITLGLALLVLGFLIAAQLASEGPRIRYTSQERTPLVETVLDLQAQQEGLKQQILDARQAIQDLEAAGEGGAAVTQQLNDQLEQARIGAGLVALSGPGLVIQLSDSTRPYRRTATSVTTWSPGRTCSRSSRSCGWRAPRGSPSTASGSSVSTAIVDIGGSVLVNSAYVAPPYQVSAIGPADMFDKLTRQQGFVDFIRARAETFGIGVSYATPGALICPPTRAPSTCATGAPTAEPEPVTVEP